MATTATGSSQLTVDRAGIVAIEPVIRPCIRRTPVIRIEAGDLGLAGQPLALKLEYLQHTGSFKPRGAFANLLTRAVPSAGIAAASGGNHGAAVAYAAMRLGIRATIFVPSITSPTKLERIRGYGAELIVRGERYADALQASEEFVARSGALAIHAYDQPETMLGQGTVGCEIEADAPDLDTLLVAVGGGGLIGGIAADSLAPKQVGQLMFPLAQKYVHQVSLVEDDEIRNAQKDLWDRLRLVTEAGGAAAYAALLSRRYRPEKSERVGVLVCGGNTTAVDFSR